MPSRAVRGEKRPVTIVGAGFSGLASAYFLTRAGFQVEVFEERARAGGMISTVRTPFGLVETAANGLLNSALVEELFAYVNLPVTAPLREARRRFIFRRGKPRRWPLGLAATGRVAWFALRYFVCRSRLAPRDGETIRIWGARVLGREASQYTIEAALQGIYAGDPHRMSARLIFAALFARNRGPRAPRPQLRGTVCAPDGMGELMLALKRRLEERGVRFHFEHPFAAPVTEPRHPLVIATSAPQAATLLKVLDPVRGQALNSVECLPLISATVSFRDPPGEARGFGCLFPPSENRRALGVLMNNFIFPHRVIKGFAETWIFGGARADRTQIAMITDQEILNLAAEERQATLDTSGEIIGSLITRWPLALPHYTLELEKTLPELQGLRQNSVLIGNYLGQIGLAKILERAAKLPQEIDTNGSWHS